MGRHSGGNLSHSSNEGLSYSEVVAAQSFSATPTLKGASLEFVSDNAPFRVGVAEIYYNIN